MRSTGPMPVRIMLAFRNPSTGFNPPKTQYPTVPRVSEKVTMPLLSRKLRASRRRKTGSGASGWFLRSGMDGHSGSGRHGNVTGGEAELAGDGDREEQEAQGAQEYN